MPCASPQLPRLPVKSLLRATYTDEYVKESYGLMLFDKGRVVHAEYRNAVGEEAFGALLAASHANGAGRFCFLPTPASDSTALPRTIDKSIDQLLLSSATAIDEKG